MSPFEAHLRIGGAWVLSDAEGAARIGGVSQPFGPPAGGTVDEWFTFPTPVNPDWPDDNTNVGIRFGVSIAGEWIGNRVWRPVTLSAGQQVFGVNDDTGATIAAPTAIPDATPGGAWVEQLFSASVAVAPGVNYIAGYHTNRYGFTRVTEGWTIPHTTEHMYTDPESYSATAVYVFGGAGVNYPWTGSPNFHYNVSPVVRFPA